MALNKSLKHTPSSRCSYFSDITASTGKQTSFLVPVRIKVNQTPSQGPLSCEKKNPSKMLQPVLIKNLFQSTQKEKQNTALTSASTQKKRRQTQRQTQAFLNTQSCHKPKPDETQESSFFSRKSQGGTKVRRQLYQNLDSPKESDCKENTIKPVRMKTRTHKQSEVPAARKSTAAVQNKNRTSLLLPPNSIKNTIINNSGSKFKAPISRQIPKNNSTINRNTESVINASEAQSSQRNETLTNSVKAVEEVEMELDIKENSATSSQMSKTFMSKSLNNLNQFGRPTVIINGLKTNFVNDGDPLSLGLKNLTMQDPSCSCNCKKSETSSNKFDLSKLNDLNEGTKKQFVSHLESSIKACKEQSSMLRQSLEICENQRTSLEEILKFITNISTLSLLASDKFQDNNDSTNNLNSSSTTITDVNLSHPDELRKCESTKLIPSINADESNTFFSNCNEKQSSSINETATLVPKVIQDLENKPATEEIENASKIPVFPAKILVSDFNQESKDTTMELSDEIVRLSTIGEVSYEVDLSEKDDASNKENFNIYHDSSNQSIGLKTPKTPRRKSSLNIYRDSPRRSSRLAEKRRSLSLQEQSYSKEDSFEKLENELNVEVRPKYNSISSKSLPASPMKGSTTPMQWDKRVEKPLQEYMAMKMNGTFLVTPDVKRFQSFLDPSDTPQHSRKSLSRKIFMELCDLYAESPESK
ncbi:hypothetical protein TKK_0012163 [Trichogramma kaykai]